MKTKTGNPENGGFNILLLHLLPLLSLFPIGLSGCFAIREDKGPEDPYHFLDRIESADHPAARASPMPQSAPLRVEKPTKETAAEIASETSPTEYPSFQEKERTKEDDHDEVSYAHKLNSLSRRLASAPPSSGEKGPQNFPSPPDKPLTSSPYRLNRMGATSNITPGLGVTFLDYVLGGVETVSEVMLTPKLLGSIALNHHWSLGGNLYYTALSLWSSHPENELSILGANLRAGYSITLSDWEIIIMSGWYYTTTFGYGYHDVQGPALYPAVRTTFGELEVSFYVKFSPILSDDSFLSLTNSELALGADCVIARTKNGNPIRITLDIARLSVALPDGSAESKSYTLGGSFSF